MKHTDLATKVAIPGAMFVSCVTCQHFRLQQAGYELASLGYGRCPRSRERGRLLSACRWRLCAGHVPISPATSERRQAFITHYQE